MKTLKCFLLFHDQIKYIQNEYRKYIQRENNQFSLYKKYWNFMISFIYEKMKKNKIKKSSQYAKKLMCINEDERNAIIKEDLHRSKRIYVSRYMENKIFKKKYLVE